MNVTLLLLHHLAAAILLARGRMMIVHVLTTRMIALAVDLNSLLKRLLSCCHFSYTLEDIKLDMGQFRGS